MMVHKVARTSIARRKVFSSIEEKVSTVLSCAHEGSGGRNRQFECPEGELDRSLSLHDGKITWRAQPGDRKA